MPYIHPSERSLFDSNIDRLAHNIVTAGQLNYIITRLIHKKIENDGLNYAHLNELIGVLECVKQELYRKIAIPYEDKKCSENGDIGVLT